MGKKGLGDLEPAVFKKKVLRGTLRSQEENELRHQPLVRSHPHTRARVGAHIHEDTKSPPPYLALCSGQQRWGIVRVWALVLPETW